MFPWRSTRRTGSVVDLGPVSGRGRQSRGVRTRQHAADRSRRPPLLRAAVRDGARRRRRTSAPGHPILLGTERIELAFLGADLGRGHRGRGWRDARRMSRDELHRIGRRSAFYDEIRRGRHGSAQLERAGNRTGLVANGRLSLGGCGQAKPNQHHCNRNALFASAFAAGFHRRHAHRHQPARLALHPWSSKAAITKA
ncbi:MAG: hypothetical protein JWL93_2519 [Hyphomicrobiales bacterium]|nr:hypothetical protein [Hyphomicrobiales bacterium]